MTELLLVVTLFSGLNLLGTVVGLVKISFWAGEIDARVANLEARQNRELNGRAMAARHGG